MKNILQFLCVALFTGVAFSSCTSNLQTDTPPAQKEFPQPAIRPLKFDKVKNIDIAAIKTTTVHPLIKKLDFNKIPAHSYDTAAARVVHYETQETKIDYADLPAKDFDVDKLPSKPLKLVTTKLPLPKFIKCGQPHLKDLNLLLFDLGEAQGLPGAFATCVFTDNDNFLWIATNQGLYRYDGENALLYISGPLDTYFIGMLQDDQGRFWLSTLNGELAMLDIKKGTLSKMTASANARNNLIYMVLDKQQRIWETSFMPNGVKIIDTKTLSFKWIDGTRGLTNSLVTGLKIDHSGQVWIGTIDGVNIINPQTKKIRVLSKTNGLKSDTTGVLLCDHNGNIWLKNHGVNIFNPTTGTLATIKGPQFFNNNPLIGFSEDINGRIWVASQKKGIALIDPLKHNLQNINKATGLADNLVLNIWPDKKGQAWVPTLKGLNKIGFINNLQERIGNVAVASLIEDEDGLFWEGTTNGVNVIDRKNKTYRHLGVVEGLCNDTIQNIIEKDNKIFIGTNGGVDIIGPSRATITHLGLKEGLNDAATPALLADNVGNIWLGGLNNGLDVYYPASNTVKHIGKAQGLDQLSIVDIKQDKQRGIWLSTAGDIYKISQDLKVIKGLNLIKGNKTLLADDYGDVWIGTTAGIFIADKLNNHLVQFSTKQGLIDKTITSLLKYKSSVYASTLKGVTVITPPAGGVLSANKWTSAAFGSRYGLTKMNVGYFLTDMVTHSGLYCWGDNGISVYDLSKKDTTLPPVYITGINIMDGHQYFTNNKPGTADKLRWDNVTGGYNLPVDLQLPYNQNSVQFNYTILNLSPHDTICYQYRLTGAEKTWNLTASSFTSKSYYNLAPGEYTFEVTAKADDGGWGTTASFGFTINPPWWQTWWAYILYVALFSGIIWFVAYFRSRKLLEDKRLLEDKVHQRTEEVLQQKEEIEAQRDNLEKAFTDLKNAQKQLIQSEKMASLGELTAGIAHEIQNPLNFVNNFSEVNTELIDELLFEIAAGNYEEVKSIADDIQQNEQKVNMHGKRADAIVKGMLQHSKTGSGIKEPANINALADEYLRLSYHGLRAKDKIFNAGMNSNLSPGLPKINIVQQDLGRVFINLFNNAFYAVNEKKKHAGSDYKPEVSVTTSVENSHVIIKVKDNGAGIPDAIIDKIMQPFFTTKPTGEGTGLGLSLTYDIVVKGHGGTLNVESKEGFGTEFIIGLPI